MANFISIFRIFLVFWAIYLLFQYDFYGYLWALLLTIIAFILDGVDGWVARKLNETSKLGAVIDIMGDRIVENTFWVSFAVLGWLPLIFPLIALTRSFVTDSLRSVAMEKGFTAFGECSMQSSKFGHFICSSKFSRISYAVSKVLAFILLIAANIPYLKFETAIKIEYVALTLAFIAIEFCVLRGLPVIFESKKFFER
ncbi:MAG TPA: CDP-alcohol phosphatidyltransferase family protein [Candidatus Gastranaerophilaceae bacterium]|nr:CDP-alcohol phosphatidyltransferase family protein [Candidatus Gastranaerophilaceae bacterium]HPT42069.1 CDP-alcohol phosphatidyltransferase family protein [Candidatus Gastranaerophilaceae bacterium]